MNNENAELLSNDLEVQKSNDSNDESISQGTGDKSEHAQSSEAQGIQLDEPESEVEEWESWADEVENWLGSREETPSHFSDSSSDEDLARSKSQSNPYLEVQNTPQTLDDGTWQSPAWLLADSHAETDLEDTQSADEGSWLRGAYKGVALLPFGGYGEYDTSTVYRRDARFYHEGRKKFRGRPMGTVSAERLPSLLSDSGNVPPATNRYRIERDEARKQRDEWHRRAYLEYYARVKVDDTIKKAEEDLREADEETRMLKHAVETREKKLEEFHAICAKQKKEIEDWEKAFEHQRPFAEAERERQMLRDLGYEEMQRYAPFFTIKIDRCGEWNANSSTSIGTQTDCPNVESRFRQTLTLQEDLPASRMVNANTQTDTETADTAIDVASTNNTVYARSLVLPPEIRSKVAKYAMRYTHEATQQDHGCSVHQETLEKIIGLLGDKEASFERLVSVLEQDRLRIRLQHLAQELEEFIRPLANVPTAILYSARCPNEPQNPVDTILEEVSQPQQDLKESKALQEPNDHTLFDSISTIKPAATLFTHQQATIAVLFITAMAFVFGARGAQLFRNMGLPGLAILVASALVISTGHWVTRKPRSRPQGSVEGTMCGTTSRIAEKRLAKENLELRDYNSALLAGNKQLVRTLEKLEESVEIFQEQLAVADSTAEQLQIESNEFETQLSECHQNVRRLEKKQNEFRLERKMLERKSETLAERLELAESKANGRPEPKLLRDELQQSFQRCTYLEVQRGRLRKEKGELKNTVSELSDKLAALAGTKEDPKAAQRSSTDQFQQSTERYAHLQAQNESLEKDKQEMLSTVIKLNEELNALRSRDVEQSEPSNILGEAVQVEAQDINFSVVVDALKEKLAGSESENESLVQENSRLLAENKDMAEELKRKLDLLEEVKAFTESKTWIEKPVDDNPTSGVDSPPISFAPTNYEEPHVPAGGGIDNLLTPSPLPSIQEALTPFTPSTPFHHLYMKPHWIERQRRMQNTESWRRTRDAVLRQLRMEQREEFRSPTAEV